MKGLKTVYIVDSIANLSPQHITERLTDLAKEGWKLVAVDSDRIFLTRLEDLDET